MMRDKKAPTLRDVAHAAGVSPYTVSVVLNGARSNTRVSEATRVRIREAADSLQYHPNAIARGLARRRTNTVGVLFGVLSSTDAFANPYASGLLQGIVNESAARDFDVLLYTEYWRDAERSAVRFRDGRSDGMILIAPLTDTDMVPGLASLPMPLVAISPDPATRPGHVPCVDVDNVAGIRFAVEHLAGLGHRRIAHLMGNENVASVPLRRAAFCTAMAAVGLEVPPGYLVPCTYDASTVPDVLPRVLALPEPPTAIVAGNDNIAIAVLETARNLGIDVPGALSVVGFDDIPSSEKVTPKLTTVRQPLTEIGREAARLLLDRIDGRADGWGSTNSAPDESHPPPDCQLVAPVLIVRESTAPPFA